jgi:hypothetical protein
MPEIKITGPIAIWSVGISSVKVGNVISISPMAIIPCLEFSERQNHQVYTQ